MDDVMGKVRRVDEARASLLKHLGFIQRSCDLYDAGFVEEAERIAISLRVLFHTRPRAKGLLDQLGLSEMEFPSTRDPTQTVFSHLISPSVEGGALRMIPRLTSAQFEAVPLKSWWDEEPMNFVWPTHTRKLYVLSLANKDGAHFDPNLTMDDEAMRSFGFLELVLERQSDGKSISKQTFKVENAAHASVRQIACEVLTATALR